MREEALVGKGIITLIKVDNVSRKQISVIDLNHYRIVRSFSDVMRIAPLF
jgi:hypothetical protein